LSAESARKQKVFSRLRGSFSGALCFHLCFDYPVGVRKEKLFRIWS
jgi:hypothetical protein